MSLSRLLWYLSTPYHAGIIGIRFSTEHTPETPSPSSSQLMFYKHGPFSLLGSYCMSGVGSVRLYPRESPGQGCPLFGPLSPWIYPPRRALRIISEALGMGGSLVPYASVYFLVLLPWKGLFLRFPRLAE